MIPQLYARTTRSFGTNCNIIIVSADDPHGRLAAITPQAVDLLRRLISAGGHGVEISTLSPAELHALNQDIERKLGVQVRRTRKPEFVILAGNLKVVDQRTFEAEVA